MIDKKNNLLLHDVYTIQVKSEQANLRLDVLLAGIFPELGLRGRRRLWEWCRITVDGKVRKAGFTVQEGDKIMVTPLVADEKLTGATEALLNSIAKAQPENSAAQKPAAQAPSVINPEVAAGGDAFVPTLAYLKDLSALRAEREDKRQKLIKAYIPQIVAAGEEFIAFSKIEGIASANLAGGGNINMEEILGKNWPDIWSAFARDKKIADKAMPPKPVLCNRLDTGTSGLLTAAFSQEKADAFHLYERAGKVKKKYLALTHGLAPEYLLMDKALDTYRRKNTLVLPHKDLDYTRHTKAMLLKHINLESVSEHDEQDWKAGLRYLFGLTGPFSLLELTIMRGARHQIRAHLADAGFPIVGDSLYGLESSARAERMFLHHFDITLPGFEARWMPDWDLIPF